VAVKKTGPNLQNRENTERFHGSADEKDKKYLHQMHVENRRLRESSCSLRVRVISNPLHEAVGPTTKQTSIMLSPVVCKNSIAIQI